MEEKKEKKKSFQVISASRTEWAKWRREAPSLTRWGVARIAHNISLFLHSTDKFNNIFSISKGPRIDWSFAARLALFNGYLCVLLVLLVLLPRPNEHSDGGRCSANDTYDTSVCAARNEIGRNRNNTRTEWKIIRCNAKCCGPTEKLNGTYRVLKTRIENIYNVSRYNDKVFLMCFSSSFNFCFSFLPHSMWTCELHCLHFRRLMQWWWYWRWWCGAQCVARSY